MMVAQGVSYPVFVSNFIGVGFHFLYNWLLLQHFHLPYHFAAVATCFTYSTLIVLQGLGTYVVGLAPRVWGRGPTRASLEGWGEYSRLAYASIGLRSLDFLNDLGLTILAGFLPSPTLS